MPGLQGDDTEHTIQDVICSHHKDTKNSPEHIQFRVARNEDKYEDILTYDQVMDHIEHQGEEPVYWELRRITAHQGPLHQHHPNYKGSPYNVTVEWQNGEISEEPLFTIAVDGPVACSVYARKDELTQSIWLENVQNSCQEAK